LISRCRSFLSSSSKFSILLSSKSFSFGAVEVKPPITDEVVLIEDGSVWTEETVLGKTSLTVSSADMEDLAFSLRVSIVT